MRRHPFFLAVLFLISFGFAAAGVSAPSAEGNWPQWRGPQGIGVSTTAEPPSTWSETSNIKWKVKLPGHGTSTPIVWEDKIFVQTAVAKPSAAPAPAAEAAPAAQGVQGQGGQRRQGGFGGRGAKPTDPVAFTLLCLERKTGKTVWEKVVKEEVPHEGHHPDHGFSSHSPVTDGKVVIAYFGSRGLHCFDLAGKLKWSKDLGKMQTKMSFGEGSSPGLYGETVVVNWDHEGEDFIAAFKRDTGDEIWRQPRDEDTTWSTPLVISHEGKPQVVTTATRRIRSYDLKTGKQIWEHAGLTPNSIPTAVHGDGILYATSGFRGSALFAIKLGKEGDLTGTDSVLWSHNRQTPYVPSPLLYQNRLYFFASNNGILSAFEAKTGKPLIDAARIEGLQGVYASPIGAGGRVYLVGRNGATVVLKASDTLEILSTNALEDRIDASPAAAGKELFLRGHEYLYCISQ